MNLSISKLLVAASFTFVACDQNLEASPVVESAGYSALVGLGPTRTINPASLAEVQHLLDASAGARDTRDALQRLRAEGFAFGPAAAAFWTEGDNGKLGTVFQRGIREGERVTVATLLTPEFEVVTTFEIGGEENAPEIYDLTDDCLVEPPSPLDADPGEVEVTEAPLIGAFGAVPLHCQIYNGLVNSGGDIADGLCTVDAGVVCAFTYAGNTNAINRCIAERQAACSIASSKWNKQSCK